MRIPLPANVTWEDRERVELPPGLAVIWHGNAVEVPDDTPALDLDVLRAALASFDPKAATPRQVEAAKFRQALDGLDLDTATADQLLSVLRALVRYMAVRMASEGE
jgi:hypothetical protein